MAWFALVIAGFCEVAGVFTMAKLNETKNKLYLVWLILGFAVSFSLLTYAMNTIAMGTAYAVWTGIGTAGSTVIGMLFLQEPRNVSRIFFTALVLASIVGLKLIA
ncbi:multidrug efflux SMR transporter [Priestia koreensis]|uniref:DMT family transporter n=1 Tax=Priestia koreensis TaxID=284581 RepID=UPI0028F6FB4F|nr:multidrug efflux SMR transporter [Priestia koreensis]